MGDKKHDTKLEKSKAKLRQLAYEAEARASAVAAHSKEETIDRPETQNYKAF